jgi:hypothetical protein
MKTHRMFVFAIIVASVAVLVVVARDRRRQERAIADLKQEVTALGSPGDHDSARPSPSDGKLAAYLAMAAVASAKGPGARAAPPAAPPKQISVEQQTIEARERYETAFTHDVPDPTWSLEARRIAERKLPALLPEGSVVRAFDCHAALCRLETSHRDMDSYMKFIHSAFLNSSQAMWNGATYSTPLHDDLNDGFMVTYIAREGSALPQVTD